MRFQHALTCGSIVSILQPGEADMAKYEPKIGEEIDVHVRHQHRIEYFTLALGALIITAMVALIAFNIHVDSRKEIWLSAILAFGLAATSHGFAGAMSVQFRQSGLFAQGTLGFGVFIIVFVVATFVNGRC
jgi:hypothetical protein